MTDKEKTKVTFRLTPEIGASEMEDNHGNLMAGDKDGVTLFCAEAAATFSPTDDAPMPKAGDEEGRAAFIKAGLSEADFQPTTLDQATAALRAMGIVDSEPRTIEREADLGQMQSPLQKACDALNETEVAGKPSGRDGRG